MAAGYVTGRETGQKKILLPISYEERFRLGVGKLNSVELGPP
jgi:hypothetical protein